MACWWDRFGGGERGGGWGAWGLVLASLASDGFGCSRRGLGVTEVVRVEHVQLVIEREPIGDAGGYLELSDLGFTNVL